MKNVVRRFRSLKVFFLTLDLFTTQSIDLMASWIDLGTYFFCHLNLLKGPHSHMKTGRLYPMQFSGYSTQPAYLVPLAAILSKHFL